MWYMFAFYRHAVGEYIWNSSH